MNGVPYFAVMPSLMRVSAHARKASPNSRRYVPNWACAAARSAWRDSEGWPAALWLSVLGYAARAASCATGNEPDRPRPPTPPDPSAPPRVAEGLLEEVVFPGYDAAEQHLLLRLSVLDSATPQEAARLSGDPADAERLRAELGMLGVSSHLQTVTLASGEVYHRVRTGPYGSKREAEEARERLKASGKDGLTLPLH